MESVKNVYSLLGTNRNTLYYWQKNLNTQTKEGFKYEVIITASKLFELDSEETELLANKAGLSMCSDEDFVETFRTILKNYPESYRYLCEISLVSERMFRYIRDGVYQRKEPILALAISMGENLDNIQVLLKKSGYILSDSLPQDVVIMWMYRQLFDRAENLVALINETLYELDLPLLMTREWQERPSQDKVK